MTTRDAQAIRYWPTRNGLVAAVVAQAEPFVVPACKVTVYHRGRTAAGYPECGEHVAAEGLCALHHADKERLS